MDANIVRQTVSSALAVEGLSREAHLAATPAATMLRPGGELPGGVVLARFDAFPHPGASFYVGMVGERVFYLTESPEAFSVMMRGSGVQVATPEIGIALARAHVETTRSMREFSRVVDKAEDLAWSGPKTAEHEQALAAVIGRLRPFIRPPFAEDTGNGYRVSLFVLRGSVLERRALTVARDGTIGEQVDLIESGLPAPITI